MRRLIVFIIGSVISWGILVVGILSSLTPSEGFPGSSDLLIFFGGPVLILILVIWYSKHWILRILGIVQAVSILWIAKWLLVNLQHHPWFNWIS